MMMSDPVRFGDFEVERELGRGGMGAVWLCRRGELRRAIKVPLVRNEELLLRFEREGRVLAALGDVPGVVRVHEVLRLPAGPALVMEYVEGPSLEARLQQHGPLSTEEARTMLATLASAAGRLHERGIWHRDLKPGNILLDDRGEPRLMDFGLAHVRGETLTRTGEVLGTPGYMAPEQISPGTVKPGPPSDVWALGVILHFVLSGRLPFSETSGASLAAQIVRVRVELDGAIDEELQGIISACLQGEPGQRPTAPELAAMLRSERAAPSRPTGRPSALLVGLMLTALFGAGAVGLLTLRSSTRAREAALAEARREALRLGRPLHSLLIGRLTRRCGMSGLSPEAEQQTLARVRGELTALRARAEDQEMTALQEPEAELARLEERLALLGELDQKRGRAPGRPAPGKPDPGRPDPGRPASETQIFEVVGAWLARTDSTALPEADAPTATVEPAGMRGSTRRGRQDSGASALAAAWRLCLALSGKDRALSRALTALGSKPGLPGLTEMQHRELVALGEAEEQIRRVLERGGGRAGLRLSEADTVRRAALRARLSSVFGRSAPAGAVLLYQSLRESEPGLVPTLAELDQGFIKAVLDHQLPDDSERYAGRRLMAIPYALELERRGLPARPGLNFALLERMLCEEVQARRLKDFFGRLDGDRRSLLSDATRLSAAVGAFLRIDGSFLRAAWKDVPMPPAKDVFERNPWLALLLFQFRFDRSFLCAGGHWVEGREADYVARRQAAWGRWTAPIKSLAGDPRLVGGWRVERDRAELILEHIAAGESADFVATTKRFRALASDPENVRPWLDLELAAFCLKETIVFGYRPVGSTEDPDEVRRRWSLVRGWSAELKALYDRAIQSDVARRALVHPLQPLSLMNPIDANALLDRTRIWDMKALVALAASAGPTRARAELLEAERELMAELIRVSRNLDDPLRRNSQHRVGENALVGLVDVLFWLDRETELPALIKRWERAGVSGKEALLHQARWQKWRRKGKR